MNSHENFNYIERPAVADKMADDSSPAQLARRAVYESLVDRKSPEINGKSLFEVALEPSDIEQSELAAAISDLTAYAYEKQLLSSDESKCLEMRLLSVSRDDMPQELSECEHGTQVRLRQLMRDFSGDLNTSSTRDQRRYTIAMKGLMNKFLGDPRRGMAIEPMSVTEIENWLATQQNPKSLYSGIQPQHALPMIVGGFDAVFRCAPRSAISRDSHQ